MEILKALAKEMMVEESLHCLSVGMSGVQVDCGQGGAGRKLIRLHSPVTHWPE